MDKLKAYLQEWGKFAIQLLTTWQGWKVTLILSLLHGWIGYWIYGIAGALMTPAVLPFLLILAYPFKFFCVPTVFIAHNRLNKYVVHPHPPF